jgi:hypothetical protein
MIIAYFAQWKPAINNKSSLASKGFGDRLET